MVMGQRAGHFNTTFHSKHKWQGQKKMFINTIREEM